jgi:outer membrane protein assembly factor BamD
MVFSLAALLYGCSSTPTDPTAGWSPEKIYTEARDEMTTAGYEKAISLWDKLEGRAAGTPLAQQAQLEKAYAQYKNGDKARALATLDRFIRLHPSSQGLDYALYLKGLVQFNEDLGILSSVVHQDLSERDQKAAKASFEAFRELVARFPDSKYTPEARQRMTYIVNALAQYEVHVARYYFSRGAYLAAINRAQTAVTEYRNVPATKEALTLMVQSYDALGMTQLRDDTLRVQRQNYPTQAVADSAAQAAAPASSAGPWWKLW